MFDEATDPRVLALLRPQSPCREMFLGTNAVSRADRPETLARLARAAGCPDSEPPIPWLTKRGLIERVDGDGGCRFRSSPGPLIRIIGTEAARRHGVFKYHAPAYPHVEAIPVNSCSMPAANC
jgi:hypothetical protein